MKKSKAQKEDEAQTSLVLNIRSMLGKARYELEIDAYRGVFDKFGQNSFSRCSQVPQGSFYDKNTNVYEAINCPCIQSWAQDESQKKKAFKGNIQ